MNKKSFFVFLILFTVILFVLVGLLSRIEEVRPYKGPLQKDVFEVSSLTDQGSHSLREAIIEVNASQRPAAIQFKVSGAIILESPLPPLLNKKTAITGHDGVAIDASRISGDDFAWTVGGSDQVISGLAFYGKGNKGLLVLSGKGHIEKCRFEGFDAAVTLGGNNIIVEKSVLGANKRGIEVMDGAQFAHILSNEFKENLEAGLWAVWPGRPRDTPAFLKAAMNRVSYSPAGMILSLDRAEIEKNVVEKNTKGIYLINSKNILIKNNEVYQNHQHGIILEDSLKNRVTENNLYQNGISGVLMNRSAGNLILGNRIFSNGMQGVTEVLTNIKSSLLPNHIKGNIIIGNGDGVYVVGSSPILKDNAINQNRSAGIRISDYAVGEKRYVSLPLIEGRETVDPVVRAE